MRDNFLHNSGNLFRLAERHMRNPINEMSAEHLTANFGVSNPICRFVSPMAALLAAATLLSSLLWHPSIDMAFSVYEVIISAIQPFMLYYLIKVASCQLFFRFGVEHDTELKAQIVTLQMMLLYFVITFVSTILPGAKLLAVLYVYAFFMLWQIAGSFLNIAEERRLTFMLLEMAVCAVAYLLIIVVISKITPKHPTI